MEEVKKGKKKNKVASLLLALALILTCGVAGTIAQYQKTFEGTSNAANIASFKVSAGALGTAQDANIELFASRIDTGTHADGENVAATKIAPGTQGSVDISLKNNSDVTVEATLAATIVSNDLNVPLKFAVTNSADTIEETSTEWKDTLTDAIGTATTTIRHDANENDKTVKKYLHWVWKFDEGNTAADTAIGETTDLDGKGPVVKITATFKQVD